jgi:dynein heavy chain 1
MAKDAKRVYLCAVGLIETVRTYGQTLDLVENNQGIEWLVAEHRSDAQRMVFNGEQLSGVHVRRTSLTLNDAGMNICWDSFVN